MNTEHIISLARKAGWGFSNSRDSDFVKAQLCFAELVAAEEREACAKIVEESSLPDAYSQECMPDIANDIRARGYKQDGQCKLCTDGCPACDARKLQAQRTWVGLTDEDISEIVRGTHNTGSFVRAIEAKLKEKNT